MAAILGNSIATGRDSYSDRVRAGNAHEAQIERQAGNVTGINGKGQWHGKLFPSFSDAAQARRDAIEGAIDACRNHRHIH